MKNTTVKNFLFVLLLTMLTVSGCATVDKEARKKTQLDELQKKFSWWPTDAKPAPVKDDTKGGYWWWPTKPGTQKLWGNRGYVYVYKIIFDYKEEELPPAQPKELRPSLLIKQIIKNVKVYFDYDKSYLRQDAKAILEKAVKTLNKNEDADILITGNCDTRGSEKYNNKLGRKRADAVKNFMLENGISEDRIRIVSRGKLDAVAPLTDLVGMQKDRNAQFMIAVVEEVMLPTPEPGQKMDLSAVIPEDAKKVEDGKYIEEKKINIEGEVKVDKKDYIIQKGDSLWTIAAKELGSGHRWKYLYEINKDRIKNPNKLKSGTRITIPIE